MSILMGRKYPSSTLAIKKKRDVRHKGSGRPSTINTLTSNQIANGFTLKRRTKTPSVNIQIWLQVT